MIRDEIIELVQGYNAWAGLTAPELADKILALIAPELEKAKKWDKVKAIAEVVVLAPCGECCNFAKLCLSEDVDLCDACKLVVKALEKEELQSKCNLSTEENPQ